MAHPAVPASAIELIAPATSEIDAPEISRDIRIFKRWFLWTYAASMAAIGLALHLI